MRHVAILSLVLIAAGVCTVDVLAQLYPVRHRPADATYRYFATPHFELIYEVGLHAEALEMAKLLERVYPGARFLAGLKRDLRMPVILNHFTDRANGFVSPLPFRQEIESVNLRGKTLSPRFHSWFETVAPHELMHAVHAESGDGFGVGWILRRLGRDLARSLNLSGPRGINEGAAVWFESRLRPSAGRLNYSLFEMEFRAAMLSDDPWSLAQMLEAPAYTRPYDRYYHGGAHLFEYMVEAGGNRVAGRNGDGHPDISADELAFFHRSRNFYYRFPLLGYGPALWYGARMRPATLERRLQAYYRNKGREFQTELGQTTEAEVIASTVGAAYRRPRWLDDNTIVAYLSGYDIRPGFYRVDVESGERELISHQALTEDAYWSFSADRSGIFFSRYVPSMFTPARSIAEIFFLQMSTGQVTRVTRDGRAFGAISSNTATLWALRNVTQFNEWIEVSNPTKADQTERSGGGIEELDDSTEASRFARVGSIDRTSILSIEPISGSDQVAILMNRAGKQGIVGAILESGRLAEVEPWVLLDDASVFDMASSADGRYLLLAADPGGVSNVFAFDIEGRSLIQLTNVPFGAIEPSLSRDGRWLAYVNYRHERYELVRIPFRPDDGRVAEMTATPVREVVTDTLAYRIGDNIESNDGGDDDDDGGIVSLGGDDGIRNIETTDPHESEPYRPLRNVRPRVIYPFLLYRRSTDDEDDANLGLGAGVGLEWADPLQYWSGHTSMFYQHARFWGRGRLQLGHVSARPSVEVFRTPSTVTVLQRMDGGRLDTVRVGRDERGVSLGVRTPVVFSANVFQTHAYASMVAEFRQERLFDEANRTIRPADDRVTLNPSINLSYRVQANPRDIVPNTGLVVFGTSKMDVWAESGQPSRWMQGNVSLYIPLLQEQNVSIQLNASMLTQNRGGVIDVAAFFPRGYETDNTFLGSGTFAKYGIEYTQPLIYIDDGFFLFPLYLKALFGYAFVESLHELQGASARFTTAGAGLGLQFRFAHSIDAAIRLASVYKFDAREWSVTFR